MQGFDLLTALRNGCFGLNSDPDNLIPKSARTTALIGGVYTWPEQHKGLQDWQGSKIADPMNLHIWRTKNLDRGGYGSWFAAVPAQTSGPVSGTKPRGPISGRGGGGGGGRGRGGAQSPQGIIPMEFEGKESPDHKIERAVFSKNYGGKLPGKIDGIASASAGHEKRDIFFIASGGPIVSHHEGNQPNQYDRFVYEIQGDELHPTKKGGFSTFTIVKWQHPGCAGGKADKASVALNFTGDTGPGWGLAAFMTRKTGGAAKQTSSAITSSGPKGTPPPRQGRKPGQFKENGKAISVLAYLSQEKKGPLFSGHPTSDQHRYPGVNKDGEVLNAGHLHTNDYISNGSIIFDAPWAFRPVFWPNPGTSLIPTQCYIEFDPVATHPGVCGKIGKGLWKVWTENPSWIVDPEEPPPFDPSDPPPRQPITGPPTDISPIEKEQPSEYGKPAIKNPARRGPVTGDPPQSQESVVPAGEEKLLRITGMTGDQWYLSPRAFHAFAVAKIVTVPDWSSDTPFAWVYNREPFYRRGKTLQRPKNYVAGTADGGKIIAPAEVAARSAQYEDRITTGRSNAFLALWGEESDGGSARIDFGFMAEDRSNCYIRGSSLLLGSDSDGNAEQMVLRFRDSVGALTTGKRFQIGGGMSVASAVLPPIGIVGELRSDLEDSGILKSWDGSAWVAVAIDGSSPIFAALEVEGKLTVGGIIDPTGMEFAQQAVNPGGVAADTIWIDSSNGHLRRGSVDLEGAVIHRTTTGVGDDPTIWQYNNYLIPVAGLISTPPGPSNNDKVWVKNDAGSAGNLVVDTPGTETIDGAATLNLKKNTGASVLLIYNATTTDWLVWSIA